MTQTATTSLGIHYYVKPGLREAILTEMKTMLDRCAKEPEFIMAIIHETPERPNEFVFYENTKKLLEKVDVEFNVPILEWGTNLTGRNQP